MNAETVMPVSILIAALGGEGGGVLSNWLVESATAEGFPVQSTSIPGVAQRTGATTYYIEVFPVPISELGDRDPVLTLTPGPGEIDLMIASELLEAGRAIQNGFISPDRTTLIASTHRLYSVTEKSVVSDGRYHSDSIISAAEQLAEFSLLRDYQHLAEESGSIINAVLLGAIAASKKLPFGKEVLEQTIRKFGIAVESNLKGLEAGFRSVTHESTPAFSSEPASEPLGETLLTRRRASPLLDEIRHQYPADLQDLIARGVLRTVDFQDQKYGRLYLDRLCTVFDLEKDSSPGDFPLTRKVAKNLAVWMAYEDVIRVADLKTRSDRFSRIRKEVHAQESDLVEVVDYLKPGIEELCALLPKFVASPILQWASRKNRMERMHLGMHLRTTSVSGFLLVRSLATLRPWRKLTYRFSIEQERIEDWLECVRVAASSDHQLAMEILECSSLLKGYGETHRRGLENFQTIMDEIIQPGLQSIDPSEMASSIRSVRLKVLSSSEPLRLKGTINNNRPGDNLQI